MENPCTIANLGKQIDLTELKSNLAPTQLNNFTNNETLLNVKSIPCCIYTVKLNFWRTNTSLFSLFGCCNKSRTFFKDPYSIYSKPQK